MVEIIIVECPFCKKEVIRVFYKSGFMSSRTSRSSAVGSKQVKFRTSDKYEMTDEKCPNCGKSKKEIEKNWKEGKELTNEDVLKRLREAGLNPTKLK